MLHQSTRYGVRPLTAARVAFLLAIALPAAACWRRAYVGPDATGTDTNRNIGFVSKRVTGKEAPSTLVARDGARCTVTAKRFDQVREGEVIWCAWRSIDR